MSSIFRIFIFSFAIILAIIFFEIRKLLKPLQTPEKIDVKDEWWGRLPESESTTEIYSFKINVSQDVLDDLQYRLERTRPFSKPLEDTQWYGFNSELAEEILVHWKTKYNWREREIYLNKYPQYTTYIQGLKIHFLHVKPGVLPKNIKVIPLLILHGWPGSVREFYEIIPLLTTPRKDQDFVFEIIAPSLPGFAFSEASIMPGLGGAEMAVIFKKLMDRLGIQKFYVQGGDLGTVVVQAMTILYQDYILGMHSNLCMSVSPYSIIKLFLGSLYPSYIVRKEHEERVYPISNLIFHAATELGYLHLQSTKPDTIGIALDDSPIALAVYLLEKFIVGTDFNFRDRKDGGLKLKYKYDDLLDMVMLYWINKSAVSSFRLYAEIFNKRGVPNAWIPVPVPTACARFQYDGYTPDGLLPDTFPNLIQLSDYDYGHFAAFEVPDVLAKDIFEAIGLMEATRLLK